MQLLSTLALCTLLVAGIRSESEPVISSSLYKDGHQEYVHQFHNGQSHELSQASGSVAHLVSNPQIQDHQSTGQDQTGHSSGVHGSHVGHLPSAVSGVGPVGAGPIGPVAPVPTHQILPIPYIGQKSDIPLHAGGRAIGGPVQVPFYPYFGRAYPTPVYNQYQQVPHQGVQGAYPNQVYPYSVSPYSAVPYSAVPYSAVPYSAAPAPTPVYPGYPSYNYPYYPQYFQGVPSYYNQPSGEVQSVTKQ